jgi:hypothetical protein
VAQNPAIHSLCDDDDDDEETARYYLVGPADDDGDGSWRGVLLVMGS